MQNLMSDEFGVSPATLIVVFEGENLSARGETFRSAEEAALEEVRRMPEVRYVTTYADTRDSRFISEDGEKSYAVIAFNVSIDETRNVVDEVRGKVRSEDLETYVTGAPAVYQDLEEASNEDIKRAEKYAFPFALLILVLAFGTVVAAGVPVLIGGVSVPRPSPPCTSSLAPTICPSSCSLSTMLGLGLGIDYALFFVSRFREELESYTVPEAVPRTVATAGRSIFFWTAVLASLDCFSSRSCSCALSGWLGCWWSRLGRGRPDPPPGPPRRARPQGNWLPVGRRGRRSGRVSGAGAPRW